MNITITGRSGAILGVSLVAAAGLLALAFGPLSPPGGAVSSTAKPLSEVEPRVAINATNTPGDADSVFRISQPGSYYLTANFSAPGTKRGIEIASNDVTVDLMGFQITGGNSLSGVGTTLAGLTGIVIRNGTIRNFGEGIDLVNFTCGFARIEDISAIDNFGNGIWVNQQCVIRGCVATANTFTGIQAGSGCTIVDCTAGNNLSSGISTGTGSVVRGCSAILNGSTGIQVGGGTLIGCTAVQNGNTGISGNNNSTVVDCTSIGNTSDGIFVASGCTVRGNTCATNGSGAGVGAGIHASGVDNRIEGNNCTGADRGIDVDAAGNFISRNICSGNTNNWDLVAGNVCLVVNAATGALITGNSGGTAPGSADPNANFTY